MGLSLGIKLYATDLTDLTACTRCANPVAIQHSWKTTDGGRICLGCIGEQVEAYRLATVADHEIPF